MDEIRGRGATHSFRLSPKACDYVENLGDGRSKYRKGKSAWVSEAIIWFFSSPLYGFEYDENGDRTGKLVHQGAGSPVPVYLFERVEELERELAAKSDESDPSSRGWRGIISWLKSRRLGPSP